VLTAKELERISSFQVDKLFLQAKKSPLESGLFKTKNQLLDFSFFIHNVLTAQRVD
jgi:hypothetical protein